MEGYKKLQKVINANSKLINPTGKKKTYDWPPLEEFDTCGFGCGHFNEAGGRCCPHYGNTCGYCHQYDNYFNN